MDMIELRRRVMLAQKKKRLPSEYQEVEWIGGNGSQYIKSGIDCTSDLVVKFKFMYTTSVNAALCGGIDTSKAPVYFRHHCSPTNTIKYYIATSGDFSIGLNSLINAINETYINPVTGEAIVNGNYVTFQPITEYATTGKDYGILARISQSGAIQSRPSRCYYFKFWRSGVLIGDFVPCYRKTDGEIGMYNTVTKTFHINSGTGVLEKGADV